MLENSINWTTDVVTSRLSALTLKASRRTSLPLIRSETYSTVAAWVVRTTTTP